MNQTLVIIALSAVAVVSAILSFVAWWLLARPPRPAAGTAGQNHPGPPAAEGNGPQAEADGEATEPDTDPAEPT